MIIGKIVSRSPNAKYCGVEYARELNEIYYWHYPSSMRNWDGLVGQWRVKEWKWIDDVTLN